MMGGLAEDDTVNQRSKETTARLLGWLGLLPFPALALAVLVLPGNHWSPWLAAYALAIISFLAGAWWGIALLRNEYRLLLASNAVVVLTWFCYLLAGHWFLLAAAGLLVLLTVIERQHRMFSPQPTYYRQLRSRLTAIAAIALGIAFFANSSGS